RKKLSESKDFFSRRAFPIPLFIEGLEIWPPLSKGGGRPIPFNQRSFESMDSLTGTNTESTPAPTAATKRVILSMGGKGGVGKTSVMTGLAEWFHANRIPVKLLDLDTENKT